MHYNFVTFKNPKLARSWLEPTYHNPQKKNNKSCMWPHTFEMLL